MDNSVNIVLLLSLHKESGSGGEEYLTGLSREHVHLFICREKTIYGQPLF